jgi:molybdenum cofactor sulfurtransferase
LPWLCCRRHDTDYGYDGRIDEIYDREIHPRLGPSEHYLDYTGSGLYFNSQITDLGKVGSLL